MINSSTIPQISFLIQPSQQAVPSKMISTLPDWLGMDTAWGNVQREINLSNKNQNTH